MHVSSAKRPVRSSFVVGALCVLAGLATPSTLGTAFADAPQPAKADGAAVVARVGATVITLAELEKRLAETPRSVLATYGESPEAIRRAFLDKVLVRDALLAEEARARKLEARKDVRERVLGAQRALLVDELRKSEKAAEISDDDVRSYYQANAEKFVSPKRIGLARILVGSEADARAILGEVGTSPDAKRWNELARERSLDKSTHLRGGSVGLVAADGSTSRGETRVDPGLYAAAEAVDDGTVVPEPVREGSRFAVVWKRQTMRAVERPIELEAPMIRGLLAEERIRGAMVGLLDKLRTELVKEQNPELCDTLSIQPTGDVEPAKRPGVMPRERRGGRAVPIAGPGGLR